MLKNFPYKLIVIASFLDAILDYETSHRKALLLDSGANLYFFQIATGFVLMILLFQRLVNLLCKDLIASYEGRRRG